MVSLKTMELPFRNKKVALVHDWITGYRGGEKVLSEIAALLPGAPIYTLVHKKGSSSPDLEARKIHTSFIDKIPMAQKNYRHYLPLFPMAAETLLPRGFDVVISTSHAVAKSINTHGAAHWCYIHSPMRYVWDRFDDYFGKDIVGTAASSLFFKPITKALSLYDRRTADRVDQYVANSTFIAERVRAYYARDSEVICPPVQVKRFESIKRNPKDFYLFFSALVPYKRADHAILACKQLGRKLVVIGGGPEKQRLQNLARGTQTEFKDSLSDDKVNEYLSQARAMIFPAIEDFGMVLVEATAAGLPVVGLGVGGLLDSQTRDTSVTYPHQTVDSLAQAILEFEKREGTFDREKMLLQARKFTPEIFRAKVRESLLRFEQTSFK
jgi:glycosyltransferase involved in cell wall biosynthesis